MEGVLGWLRRFGEPRPFAPALLPALLAEAQLTRPLLQGWAAHHVCGPSTARSHGGGGGAVAVGGNDGELVGLDIVTWAAEVCGARVVLRVRGLRDRLNWGIHVNLNGLRNVPTDNLETLQVEIRSVDSLANLLEQLGKMNICSGVRGGALHSFLFHMKLQFCPFYLSYVLGWHS